MNLCFLADARSPHVYKWVSRLRQNHDCSLITFHPPEDDRYCGIGVPVHIVPHPVSFRGPRAVLDAASLLREIQPDLLHAIHITHYGFLGALSGVHPFTLTGWGSDLLKEPHNPIYRKMIQTAIQSADAITVDGQNLATTAVTLGADIQKVHTIRFGVDTERFRPNGAANSPAVISTRGFRRIYRPDRIVKAARTLKQWMTPATWTLTGDGPMLETCKGLAADLPVAFPGYVDDLLPYYQAASVYVAAPQYDGGLSVSCMEAMACGLPVVHTDAGDVKLWIRNGVNGYVVPQDYPLALARGIREILEDRDLAIDMGERNRRIALEHFDIRTEIKKLEALYASL